MNYVQVESGSGNFLLKTPLFVANHVNSIPLLQ